MKKKMLLAVMLVLMLSVFALTGCTTNGNQFMELNQEMAVLPQYAYTGNMTMAFTFPELLTADMTDEDAAIMNKLENMKFTLSGNYLAESMYQDLQMGYDVNSTKGTIRFVMDRATMYINAEDMIAFLEAIMGDTAPEDIAATKEALAGTSWLKTDSMEGTEVLGDAYNMAMEALFNNMLAMQSTLFDYTDALNASSFAQYKPDIFTKSGNAYAMNISEENFKPVVKDFVTYLITNKSAVLADTKNFVTNHDMAWLTEMGVNKAEVLAGLDEVTTALDGMEAKDLAEINNMVDVGLATMDGSSIFMSLEERSANQYRERFNMNFAFNLDDVLNLDNASMAMRFSGLMDIDAAAKVTANIPTENVKTIEDIAAKLTPVSTSATIDASTGDTLWIQSYESSIFHDSGLADVTLKRVNGSYYLPLRQVGELLGETVTWDQKAKKAYLVANGQKYNLTGFNNNGTIYVKLREFQKAGYTVNWDAEIQEITITK